MSVDTSLISEATVSHLVDRISSAVRESFIPPTPRRIVAERDGKLYFLTQTDIDSLEADRNYVNIHANGQTFTLRWTMQQAEATLDSGMFLRIHRSVIVNLHKVCEMQRGLHGQYMITLSNQRHYASGRAYRQQIKARLKNGR